MPKENNQKLGKSLMRKKNLSNKVQRPADVYVQEWAGPTKNTSLNSALDLNDLNSIALQADIAQERFIAEKEKTVLIGPSIVYSDVIKQEMLNEQKNNWNNLTIPRRYVFGQKIDFLNFFKKDRYGPLI